ncbi:glutamate receptor ionotropic, kainate glr-3-like [Palaemon carinicauda]|uniref:glutamate receptor ionotropic, kainate glr-3-like n=1 Tax=Palaemon carinicauda TaxID=392227 RepID=UPI0035B66B2B
MLKCCWRDAFLLVIWLMLLPAVHSLRPRHSGKDVLVQNSVSALLQDSLTPNCTTLFITEDSSSSKPILQVLLDINAKLPIAFMDVQPFKKSNMTVVEITSTVQQALKIKKTSSCIIILLVSDDIDFLTNIIKISSDNGLFAHPSRLLLLTLKTPTSLQTVQEQLSIIDAAVVILSELPNYERCVVYVYLPYSLKKIQVASWTSKYGLSYFYDETLFPDESKRLKEGGHLTISAIYYPSHSILKVNTSADGSSIATISGPVKEVLSMLSAAINFTYHIGPFYSYGYLLPNGSWNGMVGAIHRKEADMALGPLALTYERSKVVQYTVSIFEHYLQIQGKRGATEMDPWAFATPFNPEVWAALFATLALAIFVSSIYAKITFDHAPSKGSAFTYIKILLHQDIDKIALSWWERMIVGGWMMTIMISGESYSGNLMSQLAVGTSLSLISL